jgi:hypothetical protein
MESSRAIPLLEGSRLAGVIKQVEADEPVDVKKIETLQALDLARAGQTFLADALRREDEADEQFAAGS